MSQGILQIIDSPYFHKWLILTVALVILWLVVRALQKNLFTRIKDGDNRYRAKKLSGFIGFILSAFIILFVFSNSLSGLTVALGVTGAGIAFALQEVIVSFAGWLTILFGGFYKPGDRVQLGGIKGDVMDIGVLRTTIMEIGQWVDGDLYNGRIVLVANSFVFKEPVYNYSGDFPFLWDELKVPVHFGSNYDLMKTTLEEIGAEASLELTERSMGNWHDLQMKYRLEDAQTTPMVSTSLNDNWVEFTLRYIVHFKKRRKTKSELVLMLLKRIEDSNGQLKLGSSSFNINELPSINVSLNDSTE